MSRGLINSQLVKSLRGHGGWVRACAAAQHSNCVFSGSYDGQAFLWDWKRTRSRSVRPESQTLVRFTSVAARRMRMDRHRGRRRNCHDLEYERSAQPGFSSVERRARLASHHWSLFPGWPPSAHRGWRYSALIWDTISGNQLLRMGGRDEADGTGWRVGAVWHDGRLIATGSNDDSVLAKLWDSQTGRLVARLSISKGAQQENAAARNQGEPAEAPPRLPSRQTINPFLWAINRGTGTSFERRTARSSNRSLLIIRRSMPQASCPMESFLPPPRRRIRRQMELGGWSRLAAARA